MPTLIEDQPAVNEEIWRAWVQKGKRHERVAASRLKVFAAVIFLALVLGGVAYFLVTR
jgi:hypothetical protein